MIYKCIRNLSLLSIEAEQEPVQVSKTSNDKMKMKSIHDVVSDDARLVKESLQSTSKHDSKSHSNLETIQESKKSKIESQLQKQQLFPSQERLLDIHDQVKNLKNELKQLSKSQDSSKKEKQTSKSKSFIEEMQEDYLSKGKVTKGKTHKYKDSDILTKLKSFSTVIKQNNSQKSLKRSFQEEFEQQECELHFVKGCKSCKDTFGQEIEDDESDWMNTELKFQKDVGANVYEPKVDDYTVIDPRLMYVFGFYLFY